MSSYSEFLGNRRNFLRSVIPALSPRYDFISVLGTDSVGRRYVVRGNEVAIEESRWTERGFVFRAERSGRVVEYATSALGDESPATCAERIADRLDGLLRSELHPAMHASTPDRPAAGSFGGECSDDPFTLDPAIIVSRLSAIRDAAYRESSLVTSARATLQSVRVSKCYYSPARDLEQTYLWSEAGILVIVRKDGVLKDLFETTSGLRGVGILDEIDAQVAPVVHNAILLLGAGKIEPGEYDVICSPDVAGIIAHEAFGHGVEADMFVKGRAKAAHSLGKRVGSPLVTMYDGAKGVDEVASFFFDDEGTAGTRTTVIKDGILVAALADGLSAATLGMEPTGNGRREAFSHKAYARMTNTYFAPGTDNLADMVASIDHGWLLERSQSGMEDPKNWGIQLVIYIGREIAGGKLTGRIVSPVIVTGYVPDVLGAVSMVSGDFRLSGSGYCGKGHKEYAKVSCGGPWIKTRMRLG